MVDFLEKYQTVMVPSPSAKDYVFISNGLLITIRWMDRPSLVIPFPCLSTSFDDILFI